MFSLFLFSRPFSSVSSKIASGEEMAAVTRLLLDYGVNINASDINGK